MTALDPERKRALFEATALPLTTALYNTALRLTRASADASDLVQETFLRAYRTFENFSLGTNCKAWLLTILYSVHINQRKRAQHAAISLPLEALEALEALLDEDAALSAVPRSEATVRHTRGIRPGDRVPEETREAGMTAHHPLGEEIQDFADGRLTPARRE